MKLFLLTLALLFAKVTLVTAQTSPFNPSDPDNVFTSSNHPPLPSNPNRISKWGHEQVLSWGGTGTTSFKSYYFRGMAFRLKFPKTYQHNVVDGKKYPIAFFFHGLGDKGEVYNNEWQMVAGGKEFRDRVDNGEFDGFLIYHQSTNGYHSYYFQNLVDLIDSLSRFTKGDPDRVFVHGLSSGGQSVWDFLAVYPKAISHAAPLCAAQSEDIPDQPNYVHIPLNTFFGGKDTNPTQANAEYVVGEFRNRGGNAKMTIYPLLGHAVWNDAWADPGFVPFMNAGHKANPLVFFGRTEFCSGDPISVKLGLTAGFFAYEWQKDNVTLPATSNEITVTSLGTYRARFKRTSTSAFSDWSPAPVVIKIKAPTQTPAIQITGMKSKVIPAPDGSTTTPLELPAGYTSYEWRRTSDNAVVNTQRTFSAPVGTYNAKVTEQYGCSSIASANFTIISSSGANAPDAAKTLAAVGNSKTTIQLTWTQNTSHPYDETGFEVYRSTTSGGPYTLVAINPANNLSYLDQGLQQNTNYYYIVRAVNNNGAALNSNQATAKTQADTSPPTAPTNLSNVGGSQTSISLQWGPSNDDVGVTKYDIYINGQKAYTTDQTSYVVYNLAEGQTYAFTVRARDQAGNLSPFSNQITSGAQATSGLKYKYYEGDWNALPDFNALTPVKSGTSANIDLSVKNRGDYFGILWEGYINIPATGSYTFETNSDDGSKLYIGTYNNGSAALVNNDGLHGPEFRTGTINLNKGIYPIAITFMEKIYGEVMEVWWSSPSTGLSRAQIPASVFTTTLPPAGPANGLNYKYYEGVWDRLPDFNSMTPIKTGNSTNIDLSVRNVNDNFGILWDGSINIPAAGSYTFETNSDDGSRLYIDGVLVVNNDYQHGPKFETGTVTLSKGLHTISIAFFESIYGETMEIWWSSAANNISRQKIPNSAFTDATVPEPTPTNGLNYKYYEGDWNQLPDFNALTPIKTGNSNNIDLSVKNRGDYFGILWEGTIHIPAAGYYTFETNSDDGSKLYIGSGYSYSATPLVSNDYPHGPEFRTGSMYLNKGAYPIAITFFEKIYGEVMEIWWSCPEANIARQKIPNTAFIAGATTPPQTSSGLNYKYYEGDWNQLPDFNTLPPVETGNTPNVDLSVKNRNDYFGLLYEGFINIPANGTYTFETNSDDGSRLYIGNYNVAATPLVNNDGLHGPEFKTGTITLTKGVYPISITFFEKIYGEVLEIWWSSADAHVTRQKIPDDAFIIGGATPNTNPALSELNNMTLKVNTTTNLGFTATDADQGDVVTVTSSLPAFASLQNLGGGSYNIILSPTNAHVGSHNASVTATDNKGGTTTKSFQIQVNANSVSSVYLNFGSDAAIAPAPWNNILGYPFAGRLVTGIKDETGATTPINFTYVDGWSNSLDFGFNTGGNAGIYPDVVLKSSVYEASTNVRRVKLSGLNTAKLYNIAVLGSVNAGFDASSTYNVGSQTLVLNASFNGTKAVQLNGLVPNASGEITVNITKNATASYGYLNAIVIESYDPPAALVGPEKLFVEPVFNSKTTLKLEWADRSSNETGMEVWRATSLNGTYTLVNTLPANTTSYTNTGLNANTKYFYKLRAVTATNQSEFSTAVSATTPSSTVLINLTWNYIAPAPWNNTATNPQIGDRYANLVDDQSNNTGMALNVLGYFNGEFYGGMNTGNNSGIFPDNVLISSYWVDNGQVTPLKLDGLDQTKKYRVGFLGSTDWTGDLTSTLTINGRTVYLNSHKNISKVVYINDISPNSDGEILMTFSATGTYGHLGALVVQAYTSYSDNGVATPLSDDQIVTSVNKLALDAGDDEQASATGQQVSQNAVREVFGQDVIQNLSAFPNPFAENFQVRFANITSAKKVTIEVFTLSGQAIYRKDFNLSVGANKVSVVMPGDRLQPGIYLARVTENGRLTKEFKLVKIKN